jgi:predicted nucleic acid-binding protein
MLIVTKFKQVFLDTNALIYHTFENFDSEKHAQVKQAFSFFEKCGSELFISRQVLREFYAISTNSKFFDEPLTTAILKSLGTLLLRIFTPPGLSPRWGEVRRLSELFLSGMKGCAWESLSFR